MDFDLLKRANPLLFAPERSDEYPLDSDELSQYLNNPLSDLSARERPFTEVDQIDYLFYMDPMTKELDLEKKMACEYAMFQLELYKENKEIKDPITFEKLMALDLRSEDWYDTLLTLLNSINGTSLDLSKLHEQNTIQNKSISKGKRENPFQPTKEAQSQNDMLQEITSYLLSNAIKKGIEVKPSVNTHDPVEFLKNGIDSILDRASENKNKNNSNHKNNNNKHNNNTNNSNRNVSTVLTEEEKTSHSADEDEEGSRNLENKLEEMTTALKDLQLAHNFLTKKFENDRGNYLKDIEKLTRTNKELQEKLLNYHSNLAKTEQKLQDIELENKKNKLNNVSTPSDSFSSPILGHSETFLPKTPGSLENSTSHNLATNLNSPSLSIMKTEFKRLLTETQRKYELEINQERGIRKQLENELKSARK